MSDQDDVVFIEIRHKSGKVMRAEGSDATTIWHTLEGAHTLEILRSGVNYAGPQLQEFTPVAPDPKPEPPTDSLKHVLLSIRDLAKWDGPDAAPKRMHEIWQKVQRMIENEEWAEGAAKPDERAPLDERAEFEKWSTEYAVRNKRRISGMWWESWQARAKLIEYAPRQQSAKPEQDREARARIFAANLWEEICHLPGHEGDNFEPEIARLTRGLLDWQAALEQARGKGEC